MLAIATNRKYFCHTVAMVLIIAASGAAVVPAQAGVGEGIRETAIIDTQPPGPPGHPRPVLRLILPDTRRAK